MESWTNNFLDTLQESHFSCGYAEMKYKKEMFDKWFNVAYPFLYCVFVEEYGNTYCQIDSKFYQPFSVDIKVRSLNTLKLKTFIKKTDKLIKKQLSCAEISFGRLSEESYQNNGMWTMGKKDTFKVFSYNYGKGLIIKIKEGVEPKSVLPSKILSLLEKDENNNEQEMKIENIEVFRTMLELV